MISQANPGLEICGRLDYLKRDMFLKRRRTKRPRGPSDRRREPRFADGVEIVLTKEERSGGPRAHRSYYARTKDASPSGLKVESEDPIPVGTVLSVSLKSPKTRKDIRATAEVKWLAPRGDGEFFEVGLEFVNTSVRSIMDLMEHIYKS